MSEIERELQHTREAIGETDAVIAQLEPEEREIIRLWYIERRGREEICEAMNYASNASVYDVRNRAVSHFAVLYFGAGALASV